MFFVGHHWKQRWVYLGSHACFGERVESRYSWMMGGQEIFYFFIYQLSSIHRVNTLFNLRRIFGNDRVILPETRNIFRFRDMAEVGF